MSWVRRSGVLLEALLMGADVVVTTAGLEELA
jgi:hypothetical protein